MSRLGRGYPNRPIVRRAPLPFPDIFFRSAASGVASGTTDVTVTKPAGTVDNDFMLGFMSLGSSGGGGASMVGPTGWTFLGVGGVDANTGNVAVWSHVAASEGTSYVFGKGGITGNATAAILSFGQADPTHPIDVAVVFDFSTTTQTTATGDSLTTNNINDIMVVALAGNSGGGSADTYTAPTGMTQQTAAQQGTTNFMTTNTQVIPSPSATGTKVGTASATTKWASASIALTGRPTGGVTIGMGTVSVALAAFAITFHLSPTIVLGLATVTVAAFALSELKTYLLGAAGPVVTTAYAIGRLKTYILGTASVATAAFAIARLKTYILGSPTVTTAAFAVARTKTYPLGSPSVTTAAYPIQFHTSSATQLGTASVVTTAYPLTMVKVQHPFVLTRWFKSRSTVPERYSEQRAP